MLKEQESANATIDPNHKDPLDEAAPLKMSAMKALPTSKDLLQKYGRV